MKEHYIEKVISVEDYKIKEHEKIFNIEEWEMAKRHGYYLD